MFIPKQFLDMLKLKNYQPKIKTIFKLPVHTRQGKEDIVSTRQASPITTPIGLACTLTHLCLLLLCPEPILNVDNEPNVAPLMKLYLISWSLAVPLPTVSSRTHHWLVFYISLQSGLGLSQQRLPVCGLWLLWWRSARTWPRPLTAHAHDPPNRPSEPFRPLHPSEDYYWALHCPRVKQEGKSPRFSVDFQQSWSERVFIPPCICNVVVLSASLHSVLLSSGNVLFRTRSGGEAYVSLPPHVSFHSLVERKCLGSTGHFHSHLVGLQHRRQDFLQNFPSLWCLNHHIQPCSAWHM